MLSDAFIVAGLIVTILVLIIVVKEISSLRTESRINKVLSCIASANKKKNCATCLNAEKCYEVAKYSVGNSVTRYSPVVLVGKQRDKKPDGEDGSTGNGNPDEGQGVGGNEEGQGDDQSSSDSEPGDRGKN